MKQIDYSLYAITDPRLIEREQIPQAVEEAILGGATIIQLREKELSSLDFYDLALKVKEVTDRYLVPLIINDRLDIMLAVDAAGVHLGEDDLPIDVARKLVGLDKIIGASFATPKLAQEAEAQGADYLGVGPVFSTGTKSDAGMPIGIEGLVAVKEAVQIPVVGIGGISQENTAEVAKVADGIAVISAIFGKEKIQDAAKKLFVTMNLDC